MKKAKLQSFKTGLKLFDTKKLKAPPKKADAELQTKSHRDWAFQVKDRAGWRCEWITESGERCSRSREKGDRMHADHIVERKDGGDPQGAGQCLCTQHNTLKGNQARRARGESSFGIA